MRTKTILITKILPNIHQMFLSTKDIFIHILLWCAFWPKNAFNHSNECFFCMQILAVRLSKNVLSLLSSKHMNVVKPLFCA